MTLSSEERCLRLLNTTRFVTLATVSADGEAWASTVNYVYRSETQTLLWYSMSDARHSRNIEQVSVLSGSLFRTDLGAEAPPVGLDGIQFCGTARSVPDDEVQSAHESYYRINFPDERIRAQWVLPLAEFKQSEKRSFYELTIEQLWLLDLDRWSYDKNDQRIEVVLPFEGARL